MRLPTFLATCRVFVATQVASEIASLAIIPCNHKVTQHFCCKNTLYEVESGSTFRDAATRFATFDRLLLHLRNEGASDLCHLQGFDSFLVFWREN